MWYEIERLWNVKLKDNEARSPVTFIFKTIHKQIAHQLGRRTRPTTINAKTWILLLLYTGYESCRSHGVKLGRQEVL